MFNKSTYVGRRNILKKLVKSGVILFTGNSTFFFDELSTAHFRQDSSFIYYFGLQNEGLAAIIDLDEDKDIIFGNDRSVDHIIWMGTTESIASRAEKAGVTETKPLSELEIYLKTVLSAKRKVHFLPQTKFENLLAIDKLLGIHPSRVNDHFSMELVEAVIAQRSIKSDEEIEEMEKALEISYAMNTLAMKMTSPDISEAEVAGAVEGMALSMGKGISFPVIFSVNGHILHNHSHHNTMRKGDIAVLDSGAFSSLQYSSDITRTIPVSGKFTDKQKDIYNTVLDAMTVAINAIEPEKLYKDIHLLACQTITVGLKDLGIMKGDPKAAVEAGAHALFMPHGLGHMIGLDVHDMEDLGETYVGYNEEIKRSEQFGLAFLRLAKELEPGFALTVEPGCYFIPALIDQWKAERKHKDFINYDRVEEYRDFGGIRIEDDVLVTHQGSKILGPPIPKTVEDVEEACNE